MPEHAKTSSALRAKQKVSPGRSVDQGQVLIAYLSAGAGIAASIGLHTVLHGWVISEPAPIIFFLPIILAAYLGGLWPGLVSTAVSTLASIYFLFPPVYTLYVPRPVDRVRLVSLALSGILISVVCEALRRSRGRIAGSEAEYRLVMENISDVVWVLDVETRTIRFLSPSIERLLGYTAGEICAANGGWWRSWLPGEDAEQLLGERLDAFSSGYTGDYTDEVRQTRKDGSQVWVETVSRFVRNAENGRVELYATSRPVDARKQVEGALRASHERYSSLFENMLEGYARCRVTWENGRVVDYVFLDVNPAFEKLTGLKNPVGRTAIELIPGIAETNQPLLATYAEVCRTGIPQRTETFVPSLNGWFTISVYTAAPDEFVVVFDNITEQKEAQNALLLNEARLRLATDSAKAGVWEWDLRTGRNYWSDEIWRLYGLEKGCCEPCFESWLHTLVPEDREHAAAAVREAAEQGAELHTEWRRVNGSGGPRWLMSRGRPIRRGDGLVERYTGIVIDITERKLAEERLREREEWFRVLVDRAADIVLVHDHQGRLIEVNRRACETLGYSREELLSMTVMDLEQDYTLESVQLAWNNVVAGETYMLFGRQRRRDGSVFPVEVGLSLMELRGNRYYMALVRDITERRRAEQQLLDMNSVLEARVAERTRELVAANRELESFCYSVSHDLRAPLRAIDGFARSLEEDFREMLAGAGCDYLDRVIAAASRMGQLIDDLLSLSRISRYELVRNQVDLSAAVRAIVAEYQMAHPERILEVKIEDGVNVTGDSRLVKVMLDNLLGNALKFTSHRQVGRIEFGRTSDGGGRSVCFVRDNGAGFDMSYAHKLFGAFQRLHSMKEFPGSGIGLATVQRIVNRHGGRVWAEAAVEQGATFYFELDEQVQARSANGDERRQSHTAGGRQSG